MNGVRSTAIRLPLLLAGILTAASTAAPGAVDALILDNGDPGTSSKGVWQASIAGSPYGQDALYARYRGSYTFAAQLDPGTYRVHLWWASSSALATQVPVLVTTASGELLKVLINQSANGGQWNLIGTFDLGANARVRLRVTTRKPVCADAVRFEAVPAVEPLPDPAPPPADPPPADTTPPQVSIVSPASGATVSGKISVAAAASDAGGIAGVQFLLDGSPLGWEIASAPYSTVWDTTAAAEGSHRLSALARDAAGNTAAAPEVLVQVLNLRPQGLVAAYAFQEGSGASVSDASGFNNHGSISGAAWAAGKFGSGLSFDGMNDLVLVQDSSSLDLSTGMTLEAWVQPAGAISYWACILQKEVDAWFLHAGSSSGGRPAVGGTFNGAVRYLNGPAALPLNTWTHIAGTFDGTRLRFFVNGVEAASAALAASLQVNNSPLRLGGNTYSGEFFKGLIDEVRIYNYALSPAEIQRDMGTPIAGEAAPLPPPPAPPAPAENWAALTWSAPAVNADGTPVTDLAGFKVYMGTQSGVYTAAVDVGQVTQHTVTSLAPGTTFFSVTAYDLSSNESAFSAEVSKTIP
ncbi:MAG: hypothetical protein HY717_22365 [Planctomycetes bacterium]|nr:hypothetical protein [Planctomycetota bacterium]